MPEQQPSLEYGNYYHIYNRGINGEMLFREEKNYELFLELYYKGTSIMSYKYFTSPGFTLWKMHCSINISPLRGSPY